MDKKSLSERDISTKFITPALQNAGWDIATQIREEVSFTKGRVIVRGKMVIRIDIDRDLIGWRPEKGKLDKYGKPVEDRIYNQKDFDRSIILEKRTELVAEKITALLKATNRYDKTIVFCEDIDHAERMRQALVNLNSDIAAKNRRSPVRSALRMYAKRIISRNTGNRRLHNH